MKSVPQYRDYLSNCRLVCTRLIGRPI